MPTVSTMRFSSLMDGGDHGVNENHRDAWRSYGWRFANDQDVTRRSWVRHPSCRATATLGAFPSCESTVRVFSSKGPLTDMPHRRKAKDCRRKSMNTKAIWITELDKKRLMDLVKGIRRLEKTGELLRSRHNWIRRGLWHPARYPRTSSP
jgi:hypothetical protein